MPTDKAPVRELIEKLILADRKMQQQGFVFGSRYEELSRPVRVARANLDSALDNLTASLSAERARGDRLEAALFGDNGALTRMDRARGILTEYNPRPNCNWGVLDTSDIRAAINQTPGA